MQIHSFSLLPVLTDLVNKDYRNISMFSSSSSSSAMEAMFTSDEQ